METNTMENFKWILKNGDIDEVKQFVEENKVDVNQDVDGRRPLHYASDFGHVKVVEFLLSKGAETNVTDKHDLTPLLAAIYEGHTEVVGLMLRNGADKNLRAPDGASYRDAAEKEEIKSLLA